MKVIRDFLILWSIFELYATNQYGAPTNANPTNICNSLEVLGADLGEALVTQAKVHFSARYFENEAPTHAFYHHLEPRQIFGIQD